MIASGANLQFTGTTGSGIYNGINGPIEARINSNAERRIILAKVPKINHKTSNILVQRIQSSIQPSEVKNFAAENREVSGINDMSAMFIAQDDTITKYNTQIINKNTEYYNVCQEKFCCDFNITMNDSVLNAPNSYVYRAGVFNNRRERFDEGVHLRNCGIFACKDYSLESCGKPYKNSKTVTDDVFKSIQVAAIFPKSDKVLIQPNSVNRDLVPIPPSRFVFQIHDMDK